MRGSISRRILVILLIFTVCAAVPAIFAGRLLGRGEALYRYGPGSAQKSAESVETGAQRNGLPPGNIVFFTLHLVYSFLLVIALTAYISKNYISRKKHAEELEAEAAGRTAEILAAKARAEASDREKSEFMALISHEIRTQMNGVIGVNELLADTPLTAEQKEYNSIARDCSELMMSLLNQLLDFAKTAQGEGTAENAPFSMEELKKHIAPIYQSLAIKKRLGFHMIFSPLIPATVIGDSFRLRQVLLNLLNNAFKFTKDGEVNLIVSLLERTKEGVVLHFCVQDTGEGITGGEKEKIFKPFARPAGSEARRQAGSGLGLYICKSLVEDAGGRIGFSSEENVGSTFWFEMPYRVPEPGVLHAGTERTEQPEQPGEARIRLSAGKILVAEDTSVNRLVIARQLYKLGFEADICQSGFEALEKLRSKSYALVLMDCRMPHMDGFEATKRMRELKGAERIPIVALTAGVTDNERALCLASGMDDFLPKPVTLNALRELLTKYLYKELSLQSFIETAARDDEDGFLRNAWRDFTVSAEKRLSALEAEIRQGDRYGIVLNAHSVKSSAAFLMLEELSGLCDRLEHEASDGFGDKEELRRAGMDEPLKVRCGALLAEIRDAFERAGSAPEIASFM